MAYKRKEVRERIITIDLDTIFYRVDPVQHGTLDSLIQEQIDLYTTREEQSKYSKMFYQLKLETDGQWVDESDLIVWGIRTETDAEYNKRVRALRKAAETRKRKAAEKKAKQEALEKDPDYQKFLALQKRFRGRK